MSSAISLSFGLVFGAAADKATSCAADLSLLDPAFAEAIAAIVAGELTAGAPFAFGCYDIREFKGEDCCSPATNQGS